VLRAFLLDKTRGIQPLIAQQAAPASTLTLSEYTASACVHMLTRAALADRAFRVGASRFGHVWPVHIRGKAGTRLSRIIFPPTTR
jgi:hypothetical protein